MIKEKEERSNPVKSSSALLAHHVKRKIQTKLLHFPLTFSTDGASWQIKQGQTELMRYLTPFSWPAQFTHTQTHPEQYS